MEFVSSFLALFNDNYVVDFSYQINYDYEIMCSITVSSIKKKIPETQKYASTSLFQGNSLVDHLYNLHWQDNMKNIYLEMLYH